MGCVFSLMGTRAGRSKEDFVGGGGLGFGVVEHSHKDVMLPSHHYHSYSPPSPASFCYCSNGVGVDSMFSASSNQSYSASLGEMFPLSGSNSAAVSVADPFFTLSSSGFKFSPLSLLSYEKS